LNGSVLRPRSSFSVGTCTYRYIFFILANAIITLTVNVEGDGRASPGGHRQVGGDAAVVPPCVGVHGLDGQVATRGHPLPVWEHLLMTGGGRRDVDQTFTKQMRCCTQVPCECGVCIWGLTVVLAAPSTGRPSFSHSITEGGLAPRDTQLRL